MSIYSRLFDSEYTLTLIRVTAIALTLRWVVLFFSLYSDDFGPVLSLHFWYLVIEKVVMAIVLNFGLWFSTTTLGKKNKYLTLGMMLPTLLISPFIMPKYIFLTGSIVVSTIVGLSVFRLFRKVV